MKRQLANTKIDRKLTSPFNMNRARPRKTATKRIVRPTVQSFVAGLFKARLI